MSNYQKDHAIWDTLQAGFDRLEAEEVATFNPAKTEEFDLRTNYQSKIRHLTAVGMVGVKHKSPEAVRDAHEKLYALRDTVCDDQRLPKSVRNTLEDDIACYSFGVNHRSNKRGVPVLPTRDI